MVGGRCLAVTILLVALSAVAQAECITIGVSEDESVVTDGSSTGYAERNQHYKYDTGTGLYTSELKKGLWTGVFNKDTLYLRSRFYLKFELPEIDLDKYIASATLTGCYRKDHDAATDKDHDFYYVANDNWSEAPDEFQPDLNGDPINGITWNNQPLLTPTGTPLGTFKPGDYTPLSFPSWDITSAVLNEYPGNRILSLMFKAADESFSDTNKSGEYFYEEEEDSLCRFSLCLDVRPIPSPSALVGLLSIGATGGLVFGYRRWRHLPAK